MPDKKITVERGEHLRVEIPVRPPDPASPNEARGKPLRPSDEDEELYVNQSGITVFDLGTRRNEDGSYSHVAFESFTLPESENVYPALRTSYHAALLAGDFTASKMCAQLPQQSEFLYVDLVFRKDNEETGFDEEREIIGRKDERPYVQDLPESGSPLPPSVEQSKWRNKTLFFKKGGEWQLLVESAWFYNPFDTRNEDYFKVTESIDPSAERVELRFAGGARAKLYLTPRLNFFGIESGESIAYTLSRFLPVLPDFEPVETQPFTQIGFNLFGGTKLRAHAIPAFWSVVNEYYSAVHTAWDGASTPFIDDDASAFQVISSQALPVLVAVVVKAGKTYYIWRTGSVGGGVAWNETRIYDPDF